MLLGVRLLKSGHVMVRLRHVLPTLVAQHAAVMIEHVVTGVSAIVVASVARHLGKLTSLPGVSEHCLRLRFARYF